MNSKNPKWVDVLERLLKVNFEGQKLFAVLNWPKNKDSQLIDKKIEVKNMIVAGLEPATSRPVILRSTIDLHDRSIRL